MSWADCSAMLRALWDLPELRLLAALLGLAAGTWLAYLAQDAGDRYVDYEGDQP